MIDDSALLHGGTYDPAKAREYYLRTRKLKGRQKGGTDSPAGRLSGGGRSSGGGSNSALRNSRRQKLLQQQADLEKRLDRLREVLADLSSLSKKKTGAEPAKKTSSDNKSSKDSKSKSKPLTEAQKREKRKDSKERYEEEQGTSLVADVDQLRTQVRDIRAKIEAAQAEARRKSSQSKKQTAANRR